MSKKGRFDDQRIAASRDLSSNPRTAIAQPQHQMMMKKFAAKQPIALRRGPIIWGLAPQPARARRLPRGYLPREESPAWFCATSFAARGLGGRPKTTRGQSPPERPLPDSLLLAARLVVAGGWGCGGAGGGRRCGCICAGRREQRVHIKCGGSGGFDGNSAAKLIDHRCRSCLARGKDG